jgi:hypothetical protein
MSINLVVKADIIDISHDIPVQEDIFLVDTNIWLWQTYTNLIASSSNDRDVRRIQHKINTYTPYITSARKNGATLAYSGLTLAELSHVIESKEHEIYKKQSGNNIKIKEFRHNYPVNRADVVIEIDSAWKQVQSLAVPIDILINDETTNSALQRFQTQALDGYDLFLVEAISRAGVGQVKILTDDMDYATIPDAQIFTSNPHVLEQARQQGMLNIR